jgi:hypothetical protein
MVVVVVDAPLGGDFGKCRLLRELSDPKVAPRCRRFIAARPPWNARANGTNEGYRCHSRERRAKKAQKSPEQENVVGQKVCAGIESGHVSD